MFAFARIAAAYFIPSPAVLEARPDSSEAVGGVDAPRPADAAPGASVAAIAWPNAMPPNSPGAPSPWPHDPICGDCDRPIHTHAPYVDYCPWSTS